MLVISRRLALLLRVLAIDGRSLELSFAGPVHILPRKCNSKEWGSIYQHPVQTSMIGTDDNG